MQVMDDLLAEARNFDAVLMVGDHGYDLHNDDGQVGDGYMAMMQPLAGRVPFMTCPGNHEVGPDAALRPSSALWLLRVDPLPLQAMYNFSHYR